MMKNFAILFLVCLIAAPIHAQSKKEEKAARKAAKEREEAQAAALIDSAIATKQFVLEADYLANPQGERVAAEPALNFIGVDVDNGAYMFAQGREVGYDRAGLTIDGTCSNFTAAKNEKRGSHIIKFRIAAQSGENITVEMTVSETGYSRATVREQNEVILRAEGNLVPLARSRSYKGRSIF
jgi:hypothetical protein